MAIAIKSLAVLIAVLIINKLFDCCSCRIPQIGKLRTRLEGAKKRLTSKGDVERKEISTNIFRLSVWESDKIFLNC